MTTEPTINGLRLLDRLRTLGSVGRDCHGRLSRLAATDEDRLGRDMVVTWMREAGLTVDVDGIGNIFGSSHANDERAPLMLGSHIDTVINAGIYDGCYGVLAAIEVADALRTVRMNAVHPITIAAFTNEEGVRYTPDMMGSLVFSGGLGLDDALAAIGTDGTVLGDELCRIGYAGSMRRWGPPHAYLELHIEQGPLLQHGDMDIGAVAGVQGISWQRIHVLGEANHAGTTPMRFRRDAGAAAIRIAAMAEDLATSSGGTTVATVGTMSLEPNVMNVIPSHATLTIDLRDPDEMRLARAEEHLANGISNIATRYSVTVETEQLVRCAPVHFDDHLVCAIERAARARGLRARRSISGAGHDAQRIAAIAPAAMIFVPSDDGISHSPREHTADAGLIAGAEVLLRVAHQLLTDPAR